MLTRLVNLVLAATLGDHCYIGQPLPGVGFSLTADYGSAVIVFRDSYARYAVNGSFVEIAHIEGSPDYKVFMRKPDVGMPATALTNDSTGVTSTLRLKACSLLHQAGLSLCKPADPDFDSVHALVAALQSAATSYLGTQFSDVGTSTPNRTLSMIPTTRGEATIHRSLGALGLCLPSSRTREASTAAVQTNLSMDMTDPRTAPGETDAVLVIDYSHSSLKIGIYGAILGLMARHHYDLELGAWARAKEQYNERLTASLRGFTTLTFGGDLVDEIKHVVLYGDSVDDENFLEILEGVVGSQLLNGAARISPVSATARGMLAYIWERINGDRFRVALACGCYGSSKMSSAKPNGELPMSSYLRHIQCRGWASPRGDR